MALNQSARALIARRKAFKYTQQSLADATNLSLRTIQRFENGDNIPRKSAEKLGQIFNATPFEIMAGDIPIGGFEPPPTVVTAFARESNPAIRGSDFGSEKNFPIHAVAQTAPDGTLVLSLNPIEFINRPEPLANEASGFGIYIEGDSMEPAYRQGDIALIDPRRPPRYDDDVLLKTSVYLGGEQRVMVRRLLSYSYTEWHVCQFNPPDKFSLPKSVWNQALWIVGAYKRR